MNEAMCFGLDIGTRTVVGVVGYKQKDEFVIVDYEQIEHEERAMLDGQIHDIEKVSKAILKVKEALEKRLNTELTEVAIAAAGRSLNTKQVSVIHEFEEAREITLSDIHHLELEGVEKAKAEQKALSDETDYFCVAYTVIHYYLDDYLIANLEGHKGKVIRAEMIATFLPKQVTDSLYAATDRAGLKVMHLTLEPIAAINAVIPENIRLLNLALVDIGAGTSDIAITKDGSVTAYGMIPIAGDEVTESILHKYLVDFDTAETIKRQIGSNEPIVFNDILGLSTEISAEEASSTIEPVIKHLTKAIADKIVELNGEAPNAVFCVGGGSQMQGVTEQLAESLGLLPQRVALRSTMHLVKVKDEIGMVDSPDMITPLGICMTAVQNKYSEFTMVHLNGQPVQLLNAKKLTILDAIIAMGIEHTAIFPARGRTLMFKVNGKRIRRKGEKGLPAEILLNGKTAAIHERIEEGDKIDIEFACGGQNGVAYVREFMPAQTIHITVEGKKMTFPEAKVNGQKVDADYTLCEGDELTFDEIVTLQDLMGALGLDASEKMLTVNLDGRTLDYVLCEGDDILIHPLSKSQSMPEKAGSLQQEEAPKQVTSVDTENLYVVVNGETVKLPKRQEAYIFAAIFDFIHFDLTKPQGTIQLKRNGNESALTDVLEDGDVLEIYWKK